MAEYSITFARSARRELEALDSSIISRILTKIETLAVHPRPPSSRKLTGEKYRDASASAIIQTFTFFWIKNVALTLLLYVTVEKPTTEAR